MKTKHSVSFGREVSHIFSVSFLQAVMDQSRPGSREALSGPRGADSPSGILVASFLTDTPGF